VNFVVRQTKILVSSDDRNADRTTDDHLGTSRKSIGSLRIAICFFLVALGFTLGVVALALVSNKFGNTDTIGLALLGLAGCVSTTGICYLRLRFRTAALIGLLAAPLAILLLFVLFWLFLILTAAANGWVALTECATGFASASVGAGESLSCLKA
jgi:hypothetical protein